MADINVLMRLSSRFNRRASGDISVPWAIAATHESAWREGYAWAMYEAMRTVDDEIRTLREADRG